MSVLDISRIPKKLQEKKAWCVWQYQDRKDKQGNIKPTKVPLQPTNLKPAQSNNRQTWASWLTATHWYERRKDQLNGLGFFLCDDIVGIDLDHVRNADTGEIEPEALSIIRLFDSYAEVSPSGTGIRIFVTGSAPAKDRRNGRYEIYDRNSPRYLTVTGNVVSEPSLSINHRQAAIDEFHGKYIARPDAAVPEPATKTAEPDASRGKRRPLRQVWTLAMQDPKVKAVWAGDWQGDFPSQSEADWWLCHELGYYAGGHADQVEALFRKSGLYREKWEREDYRTNTLLACQHKEYLLYTEEELDQALAPVTPEDKIKLLGLLSWDELKLIAAKQENKWIVDNLLEPGTSVVFSGLPYSGKTTVIAQLMACVATGKPFFGRDIKERCPLLFVNCDRLRERHVVKRISRVLQDPLDEHALSEVFFTIDLPKIPLTITSGYLQDVIGIIQDKIRGLGTDTGMVILDPLRGAFLQEEESGAEYDPVVMTKVLQPIRNLARCTNWVTMTPHHNSRGRDEYSGSAAIAGSSDAMWKITRKPRSLIADLDIVTRDGVLPLMQIEERADGLFLVDGGAAAPKEDASAFIAQFPGTAPEAVSRAEILAKGWAATDMEVRRLLDIATQGGRYPRLEAVGTGKKGDPLRYFRV